MSSCMHKNHWRSYHLATVCWLLCPSHRGSPTAHHQTLLWCSQELWPHLQPEEDWGVVPTPSMTGIQSSLQHQWHQTKRSGTLHLPGFRHLQWCHSQRGSWQPFVQIQQILWKTVKDNMAESLATPLHKDPGVKGCRHSHPHVWCRNLGSLS